MRMEGVLKDELDVESVAVYEIRMEPLDSKTMLLAAAMLLVTLGVAGCGQEVPTDSQMFEVRDSAGIRIVDNRTPGGVLPVYAELGEVDLEIGVVDGQPF